MPSSILFPGVPGRGTPGAFTPSDPGSSAGRGGPTDAAAATITATFSLTANGQVPGGHTKFASASITASFSLSASSGGGTAPAAQITATFSLSTGAGAGSIILQQVQGTSTFDYGCSSVEISTQQGSALLVLAGWDLSTSPVAAPMPAVYVSDSAGCNNWIHVATTTSNVTGSRCTAWICQNAQAIEWLSVSLTTFGSSLAYMVLELNGALMPPYYSLDVLDSNAAAAAKSLALNPGITIDSDFAFAVLATGGFTKAPTLSGDTGWQALPSVSTTGGGTVNQTQIFPFVSQPGPGTNLATTFTIGQAIPISGIVFAIRSTVYPPYQSDPDFPALKCEVAFGYTPGDPSQPPPTWTDLTSRMIGKDGDVWIKTSAGRQYELAQAEAGTLQIGFDNHDGALTPGSATAMDGLALGIPVRVSAWWQPPATLGGGARPPGAWYPMAFGYVERWPQQWPDLPQFGLSVMIATDAISVLAADNMTSALIGDVLIDNPYVLLAGSEQYLTFSNGLNSFGGSGFAALGYYTVADAQGELAQNWSRTNQRPGMYVDGVNNVPGGTGPAIAATGQTTTLLGSSDTGFGTSSFGTTAPTMPVSGPGILYTDPGLPGPLSPDGVTVSFDLIIAPTSPAPPTGLQPTVFAAFGPPSNYRIQNPSLSVQVKNHSADTIVVTLTDGSTVSAPFFPNATAQQVTLCLTSSSLSVYVNGALGVTTGLTASQATAWNAVMLGGANYAYTSATTVPGNFTAFNLSLFACQLPVQRIISQYNTAISGQQNADSVTRVAQILSWAGLGIPRAGRVTFNGATQPLLQGPAYSLSGATAAAAVNQVAANESGMIAAMPQGGLTYFHRWALFNQPAVVTFGDNTDPTAGEIPYQPSSSWDFDNSYLVNSASVTQEYGQNSLFTVTASNFPSVDEYFPRAGPAQTISTMSNLDAVDQVNWTVAKYGQPSLRVAGITVDAAANPSQAFPAVLSLVQGQVATVIRRPAGGAVISQNVMIQKIEYTIGAKQFKVAYQLSPYFESDMLQLDNPGYDVIGVNTLA